MDMQGALRARLTGDATLAALVGSRVSWVERPQLAALPAVTLQIIYGSRDQHMKGFQALQQVRVQIDTWAESYASARAVAEAVIAAIVPENTSNGIRFARSFVDTERDLTERADNKTIHRTSLDFIIHHANF